MRRTETAPRPALIGPNAIIQTVRALNDLHGAPAAARLLIASGQGHLIDHAPTTMVDEADFHTLVHALVVQSGSSATSRVLQIAGQHTADYLLAHRIPRPFQRLVRLLPRRAGLWLLLKAISFHAWTFVGSGQFRFAVAGHPAIHVVVTHPTAYPVVHFYGGTFGHLLRVLIDPQTTLHTGIMQAMHGIDCMYIVRWQRSQP
jgi:divinyl protochlorophyllide a 8-vinyl-reductase